jgi:nicotinamide mononucleotide (NMN) deamidase PncC
MEAITMLSDTDASEVINVSIGYSNRLKNELVNVEQRVLEQIKDSGLSSLDIHAIRSNTINKALN